MKFYVPTTLESDFDQFLQTDVPNQVTDFRVYHDWYDELIEPYDIRMEIYPDATKSRYSNMDNKMNVRASLSSGIRKGDIVERLCDNELFLLDWEEEKETNNIPSMALRCNAKVSFRRHVEEMVDPDGYLIHDKDTKLIADRIPCNAYPYDGRPSDQLREWTPGVVPNGLLQLSVQWNLQTRNIAIYDYFTYFDEVYRVSNIDYSGIKLDQTSGVIYLTCTKEAGGNNKHDRY